MIYPVRTIVAGIAELHEEDPVLAPAVEMARRTGAQVHLVHAFELADPMLDAYARMGYLSGLALRDYAQSRARRLEALAASALPEGRVRCHAVAGPAVPMIQDVALRERAGLVVVGATRHGTISRAIFGTTAQRVVRAAPAPVLVLRSPVPRPLRRVLLTTDLSSFSAGVHEAALDVLETLGDEEAAEFRSLVVVPHGMPLPPPLREELLQELSRKALDRFLGERRDRGNMVTGVVRQGDPAREIVTEAADWRADLLVLGTHGRRTLDRWILGSVAEAAIRGASMNVLVIPARVGEQRRLPVPVAAALARAASPQAV